LFPHRRQILSGGLFPSGFLAEMYFSSAAWLCHPPHLTISICHVLYALGRRSECPVSSCKHQGAPVVIRLDTGFRTRVTVIKKYKSCYYSSRTSFPLQLWLMLPSNTEGIFNKTSHS
jgi:hypothetical protein